MYSVKVPTMTKEAAIIKRLDPSLNNAWDDYVYQHDEGTCFHLSAWKDIFENQLHHKTYFLYAQQGENWTGVLPLVHVKSRLFSNRLISNPCCVYGGLIASNAQAQSALLDEAQKLAHALKVDSLELRQKTNTVSLGHAEDLYVHFEKKLMPDLESNLQAIPRKQRAMVRKGMKNKLSFKIEKDVSHFYPLYSESVRNLGTPVQSKAFYQNLLDTFPDITDVLTVFQDNKAISSVLNFYHGDRVLPYYGGGGEAARHLCAHDFMYWSLIEHALEKGASHFDFGRSKRDTGSYRFKKHWGFEPTPLPYCYLPIKKHDKPNINPNNPKYQFFIRQWKKLPLSVANQLGPWLARQIG